MFRLSNLVTALFGIIAALGTLLGIGSLGNANRTATISGDDSLTTEQPGPASGSTAATDQGRPLTVQESIAQLAARQVPQNATNSDGTAVTTTATTEASATRTTGQNPSAPFVVQGEGAVLSVEPEAPTTPSEATAIQLDPSPGTATAPSTVPSQPPVAQAPPAETTPAPAPAPRTPVRAMW